VAIVDRSADGDRGVMKRWQLSSSVVRSGLETPVVREKFWVQTQSPSKIVVSTSQFFSIGFDASRPQGVCHRNSDALETRGSTSRVNLWREHLMIRGLIRSRLSPYYLLSNQQCCGHSSTFWEGQPSRKFCQLEPKHPS
jgi:hypothetical protein